MSNFASCLKAWKFKVTARWNVEHLTQCKFYAFILSYLQFCLENRSDFRQNMLPFCLWDDISWCSNAFLFF